MFTVKDIRVRYGVTEATVLQWIRSGELAALNVGRRSAAKKPRWRVTPEALAAFELLRTPSQSPPRSRRKKREPGIIEFY